VYSLPVPLDPKNPDHVAMSEAIRQQSVVRIEKLLARGVPANAFNLDRQISHLTGGISWERLQGQTLLLTALSRQNMAMVTLLLKHGADPNAMPMPIHQARGRVSRNHLGGALHAAIRLRFDETIPLLLAHGADIHLADRDGWTPLCWAGWYDRVEVALHLLALGAGEQVRARQWAGWPEGSDESPPFLDCYWESLRCPVTPEKEAQWQTTLAAGRLACLREGESSRGRSRL
jgi:hypothetical protein